METVPQILAASAANIPAYAAYVAVMLALVLTFARVYLWFTPYQELNLIRSGNKAAALSFGGALLGYGLAMKSVAAGTSVLLDLVMWGVVALVTQLLVFIIASAVLKDLKAGIEQDRASYGIFLGSVAILTGLLNAGALTY